MRSGLRLFQAFAGVTPADDRGMRRRIGRLNYISSFLDLSYKYRIKVGAVAASGTKEIDD